MRKLSRRHPKGPSKTRFVCVATTLVWCASLWASTPAAAAPPKESSPKSSEETSKDDKARSPKTSGRSDSGKKVISLDGEFEIFGKLEKPSAFYVLRRSSLDFDWERLDARFTPLVLESVQDPLF